MIRADHAQQGFILPNQVATFLKTACAEFDAPAFRPGGPLEIRILTSFARGIELGRADAAGITAAHQTSFFTDVALFHR